MKRFLNLLITLLFVCTLVACGQTPKTPDDIAIDSMYNETTGQTISLNMNKETIEKKLGPGTEQEVYFGGPDEGSVPPVVISSSQYVTYGTEEDFIVVCYEGETPTSISSCGIFADVTPGPSHWSIKYGLSYGASMSDIVAKYGEGETYPIAPSKESAKEGEGYLNTSNASWKSPVVTSYYFDKDFNRLSNAADEHVLYQLTFIVDEEQDGLMWYTVGYGLNVPVPDK